jgi:cold shock CspA family protein
MALGKAKSSFNEKGFLFIVADDGSPDVFVSDRLETVKYWQPRWLRFYC